MSSIDLKALSDIIRKMTARLPVAAPVTLNTPPPVQPAPQVKAIMNDKSKPVPTTGKPGYSERGAPEDWDTAMGEVYGYRWWYLPVPPALAGYIGAPMPNATRQQGTLHGANNQPWKDGRQEAICTSLRMGFSYPAIMTRPPVAHQPPETREACVAPGTRILTDDLRWVPAESLVVGDGLVGFDEYPAIQAFQNSSGRKYRRTAVTSNSRDVRPCYELKFEDGTKVRCSEEHMWLTYNSDHGARWVKTSELRAGDQRSSHVVKPLEVWDSDYSREAGYLAAALDGEGHLHQSGAKPGYHHRLGFTQRNNEMLAEYTLLLGKLGFPYSERCSTPGQRLRVDGTPRDLVRKVEITDRRQAMKLLGSVRPVRLLPKFDPEKLGRLNLTPSVRLVSKKFLGDQEVIVLKTDKYTYFAEGLASHNCGCGFWAYFNRGLGVGSVLDHEFSGVIPAMFSYGAAIPVFGVVKGTGRVIIGENGFRSQYAQVMGLCVPPVTVEQLSWWIKVDHPSDLYGNTYHYTPCAYGGSNTFYNSLPREKCSEAEHVTRISEVEGMLTATYPSARVFSSQELLTRYFPPDENYA